MVIRNYSVDIFGGGIKWVNTGGIGCGRMVAGVKV